MHKAQPADLRVLNLWGIALTGAGDRESANRRFQQALKLNPSFYPAWKNLAVNLFDQGRTKDAKAAFSRVLALTPTDEVAHLYLGEIAAAGKDCSTADSHFEKALNRIFARPSAVISYASCLILAGDKALAMRVLELISDQPELQFAAGVLLARNGEPATAARYFARARRGRDAYAAVYNEALMLIQSSESERAITVVEGAIRDGMEKGELYNLLAQAHTQARRIKEAYEALRMAIRLEPSNERNYIDIANLCLDHDNFDLGIEITGIGIKNLPDAHRLYVQRGILLAMKGKLSDAEKDFQFAADIAPHDGVAHLALGLTWMQTGNAAKAIATLREYGRSNPTDHNIPYLLAQAITRQGPAPGSAEENEAIEALKRSVSLKRDFAPARAELGKMLLRRGYNEEGTRELEECLRLDPENRAAGYQLAQAYRKKGDTARATELLSRVGSLNARDREANLNRAMVRIVRDAASGPALAMAEPNR